MTSPAMTCRVRGSIRAKQALDAEQLAVAGLDLLAFLLDGGRVFLQDLDLVERLAAVGLLHLRVQRAQLADIDDELLALRREAVELEQPCGIRVRGVLEDAVRADDEGCALGRIDDLDRALLLLDL